MTESLNLPPNITSGLDNNSLINDRHSVVVDEKKTRKRLENSQKEPEPTSSEKSSSSSTCNL